MYIYIRDRECKEVRWGDMPTIQPRKGSLVPCKVCILASGEWRVCGQSPGLLLSTCPLFHRWVPRVVAARVTSRRIWLELVLVFDAGHWKHSFPTSQFWPPDVKEPAGFSWELLSFIIKRDRGFPPSLLAWMNTWCLVKQEPFCAQEAEGKGTWKATAQAPVTEPSGFKVAL